MFTLVELGRLSVNGSAASATPPRTSTSSRSLVLARPHSVPFHIHTSIMICRQCHQRLLAQRQAISNLKICSRPFSQTLASRAQPVTAQTTQATNPRPNDKPAATSTSAAQPFSTPLTPAQGVADLPNPSETGKQAVKVQSSVPAGTVLKGLNFMKNKQDPVAMEDSEYPPWLWTVLNQRGDVANSAGDTEGDLFCM